MKFYFDQKSIRERKSHEIFLQRIRSLFPPCTKRSVDCRMKRSISTEKEPRRTSVSRTKNTIINLSPKPNRSETLPTSNSNNERKESVSVKRIPSAKFHPRTIHFPIDQSKKESINETEQINTKTPINQIRPVSVNRVKKSFNQSEYSSIDSNRNKEFTPLYLTKDQSNQVENSSRAVKYHFRSTKDISTKQQVYREEQGKIHRFVSFDH